MKHSTLHYWLIILSLTIYVLLLFVYPYGDSRTLNQGVSIGFSDTCQVGYEWRGDPGFFAYCEVMK